MRPLCCSRLPEPPASRKHMRRASDEQLRKEFFRIVGVDLTAIPSINIGTVEVLLGEDGFGLSA